MFTQKEHRRTGHKAQQVSVDSERRSGSKTGKLPLAVAAAAAAYISAGMLAAPAQAATTSDGWSEPLAVPIVVPFSDDEIRALQQVGDNLGANSRMRANDYTLNKVYSSR